MAQKLLVVVAMIVVLVGCVCSVPSWVWNNNDSVVQSEAINAKDNDMRLILGGLYTVERFADTAKWWHSTWAGQVPFWRPLTSLFFWVEVNLFGERYDYWLGVSVFLQLVVCSLLVAFVARISGRLWLGLLAAIYLAAWRLPIQLGMSELFTAAPAGIASQSPKDQPELLVSICILLTLVFALSRRWGWLILSATLAVCFKESGWLSFPLALAVILWSDGVKGLKAIPTKWWIALVLIVVVLICARASAGPEVFRGYRIGGNQAWALRLGNALGYYPINNLLIPFNAAAVLLGAAGLMIGLSRAGSRVKPCLIGLAACVAAPIHMLLTGEGIEVSLTQLFAMNWHVTVVSVIYLIPLACLVRNRQCWRLAILFGGMMVVAALPYAGASQVLRHALYLEYLFQAVLVAIALCSMTVTRCKSN